MKRLITKVSLLSDLHSKIKHLTRKGAITPLINRFRVDHTDLTVCYVTERFPQRPSSRNEYAHGGAIKMTYLAEKYPHMFPSASLLYTVSSVSHPYQFEIVSTAKKRGMKIIVNQNGVAYPAWHGRGWEKTNQKLKAILDQADYIIYQSHFCQISAEHFLRPPDVPSEIMFNPVDTELFKPVDINSKPNETVLILGGNQYESYRFELALSVLRLLTKNMPHTKLIITGNLWNSDNSTHQWAAKYISDMGLTNNVELTGPYSQSEAPSIFARGHILLHTKINDPCPTIVLEALSSGVPVVYLHSGGTPELVGDAGIGVSVKLSWEKTELPAPEFLSEAVNNVRKDYQRYSQAARKRAITGFGLDKFIQAHRRVFETVLMN